MEQKKNKTFLILEGIIAAIILQFIIDIALDMILDERNVLKDDISISNISTYYAAALSGGIAGTLEKHLDPFSVLAVTNVSYNYIEMYTNNLIYNTEININSKKVVFDLLIAEILLALFDKYSTKDYIEKRNSQLYNIKNESFYIEENTCGEESFHLFIVIFISIIAESFSQILEVEREVNL